MGKKQDGRKIVVKNKKARFEYEILDTFEAGIVLRGSEVKSLREGRASLDGSFVRVSDGELLLTDAHIKRYTAGSSFNPDPTRPRKLLMHKREIRRLASQVAERGLTLIPLSIYFRRGRAKVELALARGKTRRDKRRTIKEREAKRDIQREMARRHEGRR
ncbi:MAG: SsrA-binding protein SmpB [Planctomycetota bacterium]